LLAAERGEEFDGDSDDDWEDDDDDVEVVYEP
jgi:hypothetical protein